MSAENFIFIDFFLLLKLTEVTSTQESVKSFHIDSSTCCNMLLQLATTKFCCVTMFEVGGNTCNNAFQLATQQCCLQVEGKCCSYYRAFTKGATGCLPIILNYLYLQFFLIIFLTINPSPPCQLSLWEETGEPGENPRPSAEC